MQQKQIMKEVYKYANSHPKSDKSKSQFSPFGLYFPNLSYRIKLLL